MSYTPAFLAYDSISNTGSYRIGQDASYFPRHIGAASLAYGIPRIRLEVDVNYVG